MNTNLEQISRSLGRVEGKIDTLHETLHARLTSTEKRVRSLEHSRSKMYGITTAVSAIVCAAWAAFTHFFK